MSADHLVLAPHQRLQAHMSLRSGGLSVASAAYHSAAAYVASMLITVPCMLADMAGGGGAGWLDDDLAARLPATPAVSALGDAIRHLARIGIPRDRLCLIVPPSWAAWALDRGGAPTLAELAAHDCPRAPPPPAEEGLGLRRSRARAPGAHAQAALSHELNKLRFGALRRSFALLGPQAATPGAETCPQALARHRSQCGKGAMSWVTARPSSPAMTLSPPECRLALRRALGIEEHYCDRCPFPNCRSPAVCDARHARHCGAFGFRVVHDRLRDALSALLTAHGVRNMTEDPTPFRALRARYQMDVTTIPGAFALSGNARLLRRGALLDVTVADPLLPGCLRSGAATRDGAAAARAHSRKVAQYQGTFDPAHFTLWPLAVETYGRWGVVAEEFIDAFATHAVGGPDSATWRAKGACAHAIRQRLAVTLQRAVSSTVLHHVQRRLALTRSGDGSAAEGAGAGEPLDVLEALL
jgi:hypothetical protein